MSTTPTLGLILTGRNEDKRFQDWRVELAGDENSSLMKIDAAIAELQAKADHSIIFSYEQPAPEDQEEGDEWCQILEVK